MTTHTDRPIPRHSDMQARITDLHASAVRLADEATAAQLRRLSDALLAGARLRWELGTLEVRSPSGGVYRVTHAGCDCPNGRKCSRRACWHVACFELLMDMLDTEAESADMEAEREAISGDLPMYDPAPPQFAPIPPYLLPFVPLGVRMAAARRPLMEDA